MLSKDLAQIRSSELASESPPIGAELKQHFDRCRATARYGQSEGQLIVSAQIDASGQQ